MSDLENAINSLDIENRFDKVMNKIGLANSRERISVPEASHMTKERTKDVKSASLPDRNLKK